MDPSKNNKIKAAPLKREDDTLGFMFWTTPWCRDFLESCHHRDVACQPAERRFPRQDIIWSSVSFRDAGTRTLERVRQAVSTRFQSS